MTDHDHDANINESTINENPQDQQASDQAAEQADVHSDSVENSPEQDRLTAENLGEAALKVAKETAYAAAGFAGLVGEKARAFLDDQKKQYAETHPDEDGPSAKAFLDQLSEQFNRFADELSRGYKEMAEKGRDVVRNTQAKRTQNDGETTVNDGESTVDPEAPTFSSDLSEDVSEKVPENDELMNSADKQDGIL